MKYTVSHPSEEFGCPWCGFPCYVGDSAWQDGRDGPVYCCKSHCLAHKASRLPVGGMPASTQANCNASTGE